MSKLYKYILPLGVILCVILSLVLFVNTSLENAESTKLKIGATYMTMNKSFYRTINDEIRKVVDSNGDIIYTRDPAMDENKQIEQIKDFIKMGVNVIIVNPVNSQAVEQSLKEAKNNGIKIIVIDTPLEQDNIADCTIVSNNYTAGVQCALDMMDKVEFANIVLLEHSLAISGQDRIQGFKDTIKDNKNYRIVQEMDCLGQTKLALSVMRDYLKRNQNFQVVMSLNDTAALGALASLEEAQKDDVLVYGVDGSPDIKTLINSSNIMEGSASQSPIRMGKEAVRIAYRMFAEKDVPSYIEIETSLITKENISDYSLSGWQ